MILGTAAYMSPEQARGKPVDKRTDIWAFGCVLYEMLTGRRAFAGDDVPELLVAVLSRDVDLQALPAGTPPRIRRLVARCLDRDSRMRLRDIGEARVAIDAPPDTPAPAGVGWQQRAAIPAIGIAAAAIAMAAFSWMRPPLAPVDADTVSVDAVLEPNADVRVLSNQGFALSPEGDRLAFVGVDADERIAIWIQPLDGQAATLVPGSTNGVWPFWSPDGRTLGFSSGGQMLSIELASGATRTLCPTNAPDPKAAWASTGVILFQHDDAIYRTDALGSECRPVLSDELASGRQTAPAAFPDGRRFVFQDSRLDFHVVDLATGAQRRWIEHAFDVRIVAPHWAIYASSPVGNDVPTPRLLVQRFDPETLDLLGTPAVLLPAVVAPGGNASFSVAANGALVSVRNYADEGDLVWIDSSGQVVDTVPVAHDTWTYAVSHGGRRIALGGFGLWLRDLERGVDNRLPVEDRPPEITLSPAWSRDDARVAYASTFPGTPRLRAYRLQDGQVTTLFESPGRLLDGLAWSPDATALAFWRLAGRDAPVPEVWLHSPSSGETRRLFASAANFIYFSGRCSYCLGFSSAGRGLVYWSTDTGAPEVYLRPYPGAGPARQVSSRGGYDAHWSADGHTIYYVAPSGAIMSVAVGAAPDYRLGTPVAVVNRSPGSSLFAVSSDGTRFLRRQSSSVAPLRVTTNWQARAMRAMASPGAPPR